MGARRRALRGRSAAHAQPLSTAYPLPSARRAPTRSAQVPKDKPILLADGDELGLGDVRLRVSLRRAAAEDGDEENAGPPP